MQDGGFFTTQENQASLRSPGGSGAQRAPLEKVGPTGEIKQIDEVTQTGETKRIGEIKRVEAMTPIDEGAQPRASARASLWQESLLKTWMEDYGQGVWSFIFSMVKDYNLTDDLTQEVFVRAYTHGDGFRHDAAVRTWLFAIARNLCRDERKSWLARKVQVSNHVVDLMDRATAQTAGWRSEVEAQTIKGWELNRAWQAVFDLKPGYREVVLLHLREELSFRQIAQVMNISETLARVRYHRAVAKLRQTLHKEVTNREI